MEATVHEWLNLLIRWFHLVAGISWIGSSFYFMWLDSALEPGDEEKVTGKLWMVHSGGFYEVKKRKIAPGEMPATLHWFKWEAALTWFTGVLLLTVVYYLGGGVNLLDKSVSDISRGQAVGLCVGLLVGAWVVYDLLCIALGDRRGVVAAIGFLLVSAAAYGLCQILSGRAAFIHVGAMLGTLMVANVWMRILPAQRQMIAATARGEMPDFTKGERAKLRSVHNNYMTLPVLFIMLSNHFPSTYGHDRNWLILMLLIVFGGAVRHYLNTERMPALIPAAAVLGVAFVMTRPAAAPASAADPDDPPGGAAGTVASPLDPATTGTVFGVVRLLGTPPEAQEITLPGGCAEQHHGAVQVQRVVARDGLLADVFVFVAQGLEGRSFPVPAEPAILDQRGCIYTPHVLGVRAGQPVHILNSDALAHNVRVIAKSNTGFNEGMPTKDLKLVKRFKQPEVMVRAKCDIHPWMSSFIGVVAHPFFGVTGAAGDFQLDGVPAGDYTLDAWHEVYGRQSRKVTVPAKGEVRVEFTFEAK